MGDHVIHIRSTGPKGHPSYGRTLAERRVQEGSAEHVATEVVHRLRSTGHTVHEATLTHVAGDQGQPGEATEDLLAEE